MPPTSDLPLGNPVYSIPGNLPNQPPQMPPQQLFQAPWGDNLGPDSMTVDPGIFEAMSSLEPLSVRVGTIHDADNQATLG